MILSKVTRSEVYRHIFDQAVDALKNLANSDKPVKINLSLP